MTPTAAPFDSPVAPPTGWRRLLVEPRRPAALARRENAFWFAVAAVCIGAFMGQLDASIVTLALPSLQHAFHANVAAVTWVGLAYLITLVATVTAVGRIADMAGRKLLYTYGFVVFTLGSALCGLAPSLLTLDGFRVLQALGAAMLQANSVAIVYLVTPTPLLGRAIGVQGAAQALGLALGPTVGGLLLASGGWRTIFLVNVPVGVLGIAVGMLAIPRSRELAKRVPLDWAGLGLFIPAVGAVLAVISLGRSIRWDTPVMPLLALAGIGLSVAFVAWERRTTEPILDLSIFTSRAFNAAVASGLLSYLVMFGVLFIVPYLLERVLATGSGAAGAQLTVMPFALGLTAPFAGRAADRFGAQRITAAGMALTTGALVLLALAHPGGPLLLVELALIGAGLGAFTPANNAALMRAVPRHQSGVAAGVLNMTRGLGTAMGLAFTSLAFTFVAGGGHAPAALSLRGVRVAVVFLAVCAAFAAALATMRGPVAHDDGGGVLLIPEG